jgi:hypothetical protein
MTDIRDDSEEAKPTPTQRIRFVEIDEDEKSVILEETDEDGEAKRKPLKLKCTVTSCDDELHCFRKSRSMAIQGPCRVCGRDDLVDWERIRKRDPGDVSFVFEELEKEMVRHIYWHVKFDQRAINKAKRLGRTRLYEGIAPRIHTAVGAERHPAEGKQTKWSGDVYFYAQHATGSCCRHCVEYWQGIKGGVALTEDEEKYLTNLAIRYLDLRLKDQIPDLHDHGEKVPAIRRSRKTQE